jgi:hypothetical protein
MTGALVFVGGGPTDIQGQRFRAKPGTTRDNVMPIVSSTQTSGGPESEQGQAKEGATTLHVQKEALAAAAQAALDAETAQEGLAQIDERLAQQVSERERSDLEQAKAKLKLQLIPPDTEGAFAAVRRAAESAQSPEQGHRAALVEAEILLLQEKPSEARAVLRATRTAYNEPSANRLRAGITEAALALQQEDPADAALIYKAVMTESLELVQEVPQQKQPALDHYRLAASRLAALLREQGYDERAREIGEEAQRLLARHDVE